MIEYIEIILILVLILLVVLFNLKKKRKVMAMFITNQTMRSLGIK